MQKLNHSSVIFVKSLLHEISSLPKKSLGQNFLIDGNIVRKIVKEAEVSSGDYILEIGSGLGSLTEALVLSGADVLAIEKDKAFRSVLLNFPITVHFMDIKDFEISSMKEKGKLVANLPYHISSVVLTRFVKDTDFFTDIVVMVQEEMARRIVARPDSSDYGSLSVFLQFYSTISYAFKVSPKCFYPEPKVSSAVIHLKLKTDYALAAEEHNLFFNMVRMAFQQRRKILINSLSVGFPKDCVAENVEKIGKTTKVRAENLSIEEFVALFNLIKQYSLH